MSKQKIIAQKLLYKGKFCKVVGKEFLTKEGKKGVWECIERKDGVFIFALTKKKEVILEKIFRLPVESFVIELPAGMLDKKKENPKEAAKRELLEETGYLAKKLIPILKFPLNPGALTEEATLFFAPMVEFVGKKKVREDEEIEVIKVPLRKLVDFLMAPPKGVKIDIRALSILPILKKKNLI